MDYVIELGRRERKRQAIHQSLLDVASRLFGERGVARTTVDDIAEAADVARQTVFNHFPYKEALALELAADGIRRVAAQAHALLESGMPALDVLRHSMEHILGGSLRDGERAAVVAQELLHPDPERAARAADIVPLGSLIEAMLEQAHEEGAIRADLPLDVVAARLSAVVASIVSGVTTRDPAILRRDLSVCFDVFLNGISERRTE